MDAAAIKNQKRHFQFLKARIVALVLVAGSASVVTPAWLNLPKAVLIATLLFFVVVFNAIAWHQRYDRRWFSCRAVAESIKVITWRFMMKATPYHDTVTSTIGSQFAKDVLQCLDDQPEVKQEVVSVPTEGTQVSQYMLELRKQSLDKRKETYLKDRIQDQRGWYRNKGLKNKNSGNNWFYATFSLQVLSAIIALILIAFPNSPVNPVGVVTTLATSGLSWTTARSHQELSQSYGIVSQELAALEDRAREVTTDQELEELVLEVERTISREHTIWRVRRLVGP